MKWKATKLWENTDCWIIGGGSSISEQFNIPDSIVPETIQQFREYGDYLYPIHNDRVIGVNVGAFLGDWVDVAYWGDSDTYTDYKAYFDAFSGLKVSSAGKFSDNRFKSIKFLHRNMTKGITKTRSQISWSSKNSGASAINLAYHLGATRIYLLGFDMYHSPGGRMHFHTGYPDKSKTPTTKQLKQGKRHPRRKPMQSFNRHLKGWGLVAKDAERLGVEIINVNLKSGINAFTKMSISEVMRIDNE